MTISPGLRLGRYEVCSKIGEGGMGEVYLARDTTELERTVAIKMLSAELASDEKRLRRFIQEAKVASSLNHPNIVTIYEIGESDSIRFIVTEFIDGHTLRHHLARFPLDIEQALDIAIQVGSALVAAHSVNIVHRDIKPENIMVRQDGIAKVLDFGLAKLVESIPPPIDSEAKTRAAINTLPGTVMGTVHYMSPEQARGKEVDVRTDIWSLGVVIYEMLTGRFPFSGETTTDLLAAILMTEAVPPKRFNSKVPTDLERIIVKALRKDQDERYQTAKDLLIDLRQVKKQLEFSAELERTSSSAGNTLTDAPQAAAAVSWTTQRSLWTTPRNIAIVAAVLLIAAAAVLIFQTYRTAQTSSTISSLAVLPFANNDPNSEYLSDGITESLIDSLSRVATLKVKSRSTVFHYKGRDTDPKQIGRELGVNALLSGSVSQSGDDFSVNIELIDVRDDSHIWGGRYDRKVSEIAALPQQISRDVSEQLRSRTDNMDRAELSRNYSPDSEAYRLYLQGRYNWNKRTVEGLQKGIDYFGQAIMRDQNYALAYAGLADCYLLLNIYNVTSADDSYPKAEAASKKALSINENLAEAHNSLALVTYRYHLRWAEAEQHFKKSIALNPNYATAHQWYGSYLAALGRFDESVAEGKIAHELEPFSLTIYSDYVRGLYYAGRLDEAKKESLKLMEMDHSFGRAHYELGLILEEQGKLEEAIAEFKFTLKAFPDGVIWTLTALGHAQGRAGKKSDAEKVIKRLQELSKQQYVSPYQTAVVYAGLDERKLALDWLEKSREEHFNWLSFVQIDPVFKNLRSEARFVEFSKSLGLSK